jgi:hypothetical protein
MTEPLPNCFSIPIDQPPAVLKGLPTTSPAFDLAEAQSVEERKLFLRIVGLGLKRIENQEISGGAA